MKRKAAALQSAHRLPSGSRFCECPLCHATVALTLINDHMESAACNVRRSVAAPGPSVSQKLSVNNTPEAAAAAAAASLNGSAMKAIETLTAAGESVAPQRTVPPSAALNCSSPTSSAFALLMRPKVAARAQAATCLSMQSVPSWGEASASRRLVAHSELRGLWIIEAFINEEEEEVSARDLGLHAASHVWGVAHCWMLDSQPVGPRGHQRTRSAGHATDLGAASIN